MNVVPAKVAGVEQIIMCTPPDHEGKVYPTTLVAANEAGVDVVYKAGGAQQLQLWLMVQSLFQKLIKYVVQVISMLPLLKSSVWLCKYRLCCRS